MHSHCSQALFSKLGDSHHDVLGEHEHSATDPHLLELPIPILQAASLKFSWMMPPDVPMDDPIASKDEEATPSDIHSIPRDILEHIFLMTLPSWDEALPPVKYADTLLQTQEPWTLASVCKHWRSIALGYKRLWSRIRINLIATKPGFMPTTELNVLRLSLERSNPAPITIYFMDKNSAGSDGPTPSYLHLLMQHSTRWAKLYIYLSYQHFPLLHQVHRNLPLLNELHMWPYAPNVLNNVTTFEDAPCLKRVVFPDIPDPGLFRLPSSQLVSLSLQMKHSRYPINFLENTASLKELIFSNLWPVGHAGGHPVLEHRSIQRLVTDSLDSLIDVEMPNLHTLVIDHPTNPSKNTTTPLSITMFALRSRFQLTTLSLATVKYRDRSSIVDLFRNLPTVTRLQLIERYPMNIPWEVLLSVLRISDDSCLLPNLAYLDLQSRKIELIVTCLNGLLAMVASRLHHKPFAARFIGLTHSRGNNLLPTPIQQMERLAEEGYVVERDNVDIKTIATPSSPYYDLGYTASGLQPLTRLQFMTSSPSSRFSFNVFPPPMLNF